MKKAIASNIGFILLTMILTLGVSTHALADISTTIGHTIDVDNPTGLVYRDDGFLGFEGREY